MKKIFNLQQANLFVKHGAVVEEVGLGDRYKVYIGFKENEIFKNLLEKWLKKEI